MSLDVLSNSVQGIFFIVKSPCSKEAQVCDIQFYN